uniref:Uncharacterized protein n=1 Tax=Triticum urartu TaxID=4572 RepID=A0A8R7TJQ3_TRIUA
MAILSCNFVMSGFSHIFFDYFLRILISILLEYVGILRQEERSGRAYHGKLQQICSSPRWPDIAQFIMKVIEQKNQSSLSLSLSPTNDLLFLVNQSEFFCTIIPHRR